jgi:secretion/DNA translocation related TadE-like protein
VTTRDERGSATVLGLVLAAVLVTVAVAGAAGAGLLVGHRRAGAAADLAALAGAAALQQAALAGDGDACGQVAAVSAANRAVVQECLVEGEEVQVRVEVEVRGPFGASWPVAARARAGPVGGAP